MSTKKPASIVPGSIPSVVPVGLQVKRWASVVKSNASGNGSEPIRLKSGKTFYPLKTIHQHHDGKRQTVNTNLVSQVADEIAKAKEHNRSEPRIPMVSDVSLDVAAVSTPFTLKPKKRKASGGSIHTKKKKTRTQSTAATIKALASKRRGQKSADRHKKQSSQKATRK